MRKSAALAICAAALVVAMSAGAAGQDREKPKSGTAAPAKSDEQNVGRFCAAVAPAVQEARTAWQMKRLNELDGQVKQRLVELERVEASIREWVARREALLKSASDGVVAIYSKMPAETAATQIAALEDPVAASILSKLNPRTSSAILDQMEPARASKLTGLLAGGAADEKKS